MSQPDKSESERFIVHSVCPASGSVWECRCEDVWHHGRDGDLWCDSSCKATEQRTYVAVDALLSGLDDVTLYDDTTDPHDVGYMQALGEVRTLVAALTGNQNPPVERLIACGGEWHYTGHSWRSGCPTCGSGECDAGAKKPATNEERN